MVDKFNAGGPIAGPLSTVSQDMLMSTPQRVETGTMMCLNTS
jgi:hypothetical protein